LSAARGSGQVGSHQPGAAETDHIKHLKLHYFGHGTRHLADSIKNGDRALPVAGSRLWNSLPLYVTSAPTLIVFRNRLKTYFFSRSFPNQLFLFS